jgi:hypothetical protein
VPQDGVTLDEDPSMSKVPTADALLVIVRPSVGLNYASIPRFVARLMVHHGSNRVHDHASRYSLRNGGRDKYPEICHSHYENEFPS